MKVESPGDNGISEPSDGQLRRALGRSVAKADSADTKSECSQASDDATNHRPPDPAAVRLARLRRRLWKWLTGSRLRKAFSALAAILLAAVTGVAGAWATGVSSGSPHISVIVTRGQSGNETRNNFQASTSPGLVGKPMGASKPIDLLSHYSPSGYMGDIGDITKNVDPGNDLIRMTYVAEGRGPHEWADKYIDGKLNPSPCWFAGIMLLDGDWGQTPGAGYDLRGSTTISWEARSLSGNVFVQFVAGGANWIWSENRTVVPAPYPDSLPNLQLMEPELTGQWQHFEYPLGKTMIATDLRAVLAPFGWIISLDSNAGNNGQPAKFVIEVRDISYR